MASISAITEVLLLLGVYLLNLPFGYWRRKTKKFSKEWVVAIHLPVPAVFLMRVLTGVPLSHLPVFILAFFLGQFSGGKVRLKLEAKHQTKHRLTKCMVMDLIRMAGLAKHNTC
jgi:hypothetical protein